MNGGDEEGLPFVAHEHVLTMQLHERHIHDCDVDMAGERVLRIDADPRASVSLVEYNREGKMLPTSHQSQQV